MPSTSKQKESLAGVEISTSPRTGTKRKRVDLDTGTPKTRRTKPVVKQEKQDCDICAESKTAYRNFPNILSCDHDATVCRECFKKHFVIRVDEHRDQGWNACSCPLCGEGVAEEEARGVLPRTVSREIDAMIKKTARQNAHNWLWCPAPGCGHGQLHNLTKQAWVKCSRCRTKICFTHQRQWHEGLTCVEFDTIDNKDATAVQDIEEIRRTTKPCPYCKRRIKKEGGCNHMTCGACRKQWMWNEIPFDGEKVATGAEILGKRGGAPALPPEHRQYVEQVIQFHNAEIDRENARQRTAGQAQAAPVQRQLNPVQEDTRWIGEGLRWAADQLAGAVARIQEAIAFQPFNAAPARTGPHPAETLSQQPRQLRQPREVHVGDGAPSRRTERVHAAENHAATTANQDEDIAVIDLTGDDDGIPVQPLPGNVRLRIRSMDQPTSGLVDDPIDLTNDDMIDLTTED